MHPDVRKRIRRTTAVAMFQVIVYAVWVFMFYQPMIWVIEVHRFQCHGYERGWTDESI